MAFKTSLNITLMETSIWGDLDLYRLCAVKLGRGKSSFSSVVKVAEGEIPEKGHRGRVAAPRQRDQGVSPCAFSGVEPLFPATGRRKFVLWRWQRCQKNTASVASTTSRRLFTILAVQGHQLCGPGLDSQLGDQVLRNLVTQRHRCPYRILPQCCQINPCQGPQRVLTSTQEPASKGRQGFDPQVFGGAQGAQIDNDDIDRFIAQ